MQLSRKRETEQLRSRIAMFEWSGIMSVMPLTLSSSRRVVQVISAGLALLVLGGCAKKEEPSKEPAVGAHHAHVAPHGGTLVAVGDHQFNLELVHDAAAGRLTTYVLDAHAENFVRLPIQGFALIALVNGRRQSLPMAAVANSSTGETVGDTSTFEAQAEWLKARVAFDALIPALDIRGATFSEIRFAFRSGAVK